MTWWRTATPLSMVVVCNGERHRLQWQDGQIVTVDHPELEAELALVALGGEEPACIAMRRLWHEAVADGGFVAEWVDPNRLDPAWFSWLSMAIERMRAEGFHEFLRHLPPARAQRMGEFLRRFPPPWIDRAAAEVNRLATTPDPGVVDGVDAVRDDEHGVLLAQATANRLRRSFVDAVGGRQLAVGAAALVPLQLRVEAGLQPGIRGVLSGPDRGVGLAVDRSWLHRVWAAGAAVIDGHLVLDLAGVGADGDGDDRWALLVTWPEGARGGPVPTTRPVRHRSGLWAVVEGDRPPRPSPGSGVGSEPVG